MREITIAQRMIYLRGLLQRYGTLSLPLGSGLSFSLIQVFQPLRLRQSVVEKKKTHEHDSEVMQRDMQENAGETDETEEHEEALGELAKNGIEALNMSARSRIVILGGPGTGKTTVLKHLLCHHALLAVEDSTAPLPIFLSLPNLARVGQYLEAYLAQIARGMGLEASFGQALYQAIQRGQAFVCLDSLDEVLPHLRAGIIRQVNELAHRSGNSWIVGSRFTDYKGGQFQQGAFQEWELQALDELHRLHLAAQLLPELQRQLASSAQLLHSLNPRDYVQTLSEHQQAATWGENPLLFSLGAVVYLRQGNLAGSRAMLYREVIDALLETREGDALQRTQLRHMLADTALELYQVKGRTFSADDLRATLTSLSTEQQATWTVEETLYRVLNSGLLDVVAYETYSFRHQTFQEYLVASALARRFMSTDEQTRQAGQQQAWSKHTYSRWSEIERLLVGILVQEYGEEGTLTARAWLTRLLQQQSSPEGDPGNLSLELAIKVLGEVAELEEWQAAETLELEERTAVGWVNTLDSIRKRSFLKREPYQRLFRVAPEIGRLRPSAQNKALDIVLNGSYYEIGSRLGAIHSAVAAERLRTAWQRTSNPWGGFSDAFPKLGVYAPVDLLLPMLESQKHHLNVQAILTLKGVGRYAPVHSLLALLTKESPETRRAAADALIAIAQNVELPVEVLLAILQQKQEYRFDAARVLARLQHPAAIEPAISALTDADARTRQDAVLALGSFKASMLTETIISLQNDPEEQVRKAVVEALSNLGSDAPMQPFLTALQDEDGEVRMTAVQALGRMETRAPVSTLVAMLRDTDSEVITTTLQVLGRIGDHVPLEPLLEMLHHPNWDILHQAIKTLGEKQIIERVPLERLLDFYANHWTYRTAMFNTLSQAVTLLPPSFLINALNDSDPTITKSAAQALGRRTDQLAEESLLDEIATKYWRSQSHAIKLLAMHSAETHFERFLHALGDENPSVSGHAAQELEKIADVMPSKSLQQALQCSYPWVRVNALHILAKRAEPPAPEILLTALTDPHEQVREATAQAVASWPADAPLEHLLEATRDHYDSVRFAAAQSLSKVGFRDPARELEGLLNVLCYPKLTSNDGDDSYKAERAIERMLLSLVPYAPPVEPLYQAMLDLHQRKSWLARTAAVVLGATGERAPIAQLTQCLHDEDEDLRILAVIALGKAGQSAPVQDLIQALEDSPRVRLVVIKSLCDLYTYVPGEVFLSLIREEGHHVHTYSVLLLALLNKGERIPGDILLRQLEPGQKFWGHDTAKKYISYFCSLEQWPSIPPSTLVAGFASLLYDYTIPSLELEELCQLLLSLFSLDLLLETLTHAHEAVRKGGLCLLFYYPGNVPLENLLMTLNDPHVRVRLVALYCIQAHTDRLPLQQFSKLLHDSDWQVRRAAIEALGTLGPEAPVNDLLTVVEEPGENTACRCAAITALRQPGSIERVPVDAFISVLGDPDPSMRINALKALSDKDPQLAIAHCIAALSDSNSLVCQTAFEILQQISPAIIPEIVQEATTLLGGGKPGRFFRTLSMGFLADILGDIGRAAPDLIARLGRLLDWPYWEVRLKATHALGKLRRNIPDETIRRLLELRHDSRSRAVREAADEALAEILSLETGIEDD